MGRGSWKSFWWRARLPSLVVIAWGPRWNLWGSEEYSLRDTSPFLFIVVLAPIPSRPQFYPPTQKTTGSARG